MLVIFDCDGVLVDSETLAAMVFSNCLKAVNIDLDAKDCYEKFRGHTLDYCKTWLEERYPKLPTNFFHKLETETEKTFSTSLQAVAGIERNLQLLQKNNISFCVASNGGHKKIEHSLSITGLLQYFPSARFSREDVNKGKPAPDLFLYAAEVMGVPAAKVTVVEDSFTGVTAALEAGMNVLAYQAHESQLKLPPNVLTFKKMDELKDLLEI